MSNTIDLTYELGKNFIDYAMSVNSDRSIPDATTGLKPVHRRILYSMYINGNTSNKKYVKCANTVGQVMGQLHPHGDTSIYQALVRLARPWIMRYPLIDFHGNVGNESGDVAAAPRYTECRLHRLTEEGMLKTLDKNCVDTILNYDETREEAVTFPAIFPNLLCNPNSGIGVALASSWGSYNLREVATAINEYLDGKEITPLAPDFATGGQIINKDIISSIAETGKGTVIIRARYQIEKNNLVFYELPYGTNIETIINQINDLAEANNIVGVIAVRDESDLRSVRIVIEFKNAADINGAINTLYNSTDLQTSFSFNQVALVDKEPQLLNLRQCIEIYVSHNLECIEREYKFELSKAEAREHIVEGIVKALEDIDNIIALIKQSDSSTHARQRLIEIYGFSDIQAKSIVDMRLGKLANLEKVEVESEQKELLDRINACKNILNNEDARVDLLKERLNKIVQTYGDERRTALAQLIDNGKKKKEPVPVEIKDCVIMVSQDNLIKRIDSKKFKPQRRNTVGIKTKGDITIFSQKTNTQDTLMVFTTTGKMYRLLVDKIPEGNGTYINNLIEFEPNELPIAYTTLTRDTANKFIVFATKKGMVKKVPLEEYNKAKRTGIKTLNLRDGDSLSAIAFIDEGPLMLVTKNGMAIKFDSKNMPISSRTAQGVKGINISENDEVIDILTIGESDKWLCVVTQNNLGKKVKLEEYPLQGRGGKGLACAKNEIAGVVILNGQDNLLVCGNLSSIVISEEDIPELGRASNGNVLLKNNKNIVSISKI